MSDVSGMRHEKRGWRGQMVKTPDANAPRARTNLPGIQVNAVETLFMAGFQAHCGDVFMVRRGV